MKKVWLGFVALGLVITFQNCSNGASFQSAGELVAKTDVGTGAGAGDDGLNTGDGAPVPSASPIPPGATPPVATPSPTPKYPGKGPKDHADGDDCDKDDKDDKEHKDAKAKSELQYVCVLRGHGKSVKVGLMNKGLVGQNGTPSDVCMTKNACLNILSKKFDVQGAEARGFCPDKNPHVIPMTDAEIEASLAESELLNSLNSRK